VGLIIMRRLQLTNHAACLFAALAYLPAATLAQEVGLEKLNGKRVSFSFVHSVSGINPVHGPFTGAEAQWEGVIQVSGGTVSGGIARTVTYHGQLIGSLSNSVSGEIEDPQDGPRSGQYVWVLKGNTLVLVRNYLTGGAKITITFSDSGCSVRAKLARDVGTGYARVPSVSGGVSTITRSTQVSSRCIVVGR
jgi:hypothetical protein